MRIGTVTTALALGVGVVLGAGIAQARSVEVEIDTAPPPARVETIPPERPGFVYERGHYAWDGHAYVWTEGRYIELRQGHTYVQPMIEHRGEHYVFRSGHWDDD